MLETRHAREESEDLMKYKAAIAHLQGEIDRMKSARAYADSEVMRALYLARIRAFQRAIRALRAK